METVKYMTQESIYLWEHLVVANPAGTVREEARVLEEFKKQLMGYVIFSSLFTKNLTNTSLFF